MISITVINIPLLMFSVLVMTKSSTAFTAFRIYSVFHDAKAFSSSSSKYIFDLNGSSNDDKFFKNKSIKWVYYSLPNMRNPGNSNFVLNSAKISTETEFSNEGNKSNNKASSYILVEEEMHGDQCLLSDECDIDADVSDEVSGNASEDRHADAIDIALKSAPIIIPLIAFCTYNEVASLFSSIIDILENKNWVAVDGGAYQARIIAPAINGVVVPAVAILFATLISNTVSTLRQRQLDIRTCLNREASELRTLSSIVEFFPRGPFQDKCRLYLLQYSARLIAESRAGVNLNSLEFRGSMDSEMNGFLNSLNEMVTKETHSNEESHATASKPQPALISESFAALSRLNGERSIRISALHSTFPVLHYVILATLAMSICIAFLIETNQELLIFLNAIQLKLLWTILIGTFSALGAVCYDLIDPFRGSYEISNALDQLYNIRDTLRATSQTKSSEFTEF